VSIKVIIYGEQPEAASVGCSEGGFMATSD